MNHSKLQARQKLSEVDAVSSYLYPTPVGQKGNPMPRANHFRNQLSFCSLDGFDARALLANLKFMR